MPRLATYPTLFWNLNRPATTQPIGRAAILPRTPHSYRETPEPVHRTSPDVRRPGAARKY
jgi:hypothetical protein